jgi:hypothetical protein
MGLRSMGPIRIIPSISHIDKAIAAYRRLCGERSISPVRAASSMPRKRLPSQARPVSAASADDWQGLQRTNRERQATKSWTNAE